MYPGFEVGHVFLWNVVRIEHDNCLVLGNYSKVTTLMSEKTFSTLGVPAPLVTALTAAGIDSPFPIQGVTT